MLNESMGVDDKMSMRVGKGFNDDLKAGGWFHAELFDKSGKLKDVRHQKNLETTLCHNMCADRIDSSPSIAVPNWMEVGEGSGQGAGDSILDSYLAGSRTVCDSATAASAVTTFICTFVAGTITGALTEAGLFNVVTENTTDLILYSSFAVINAGASDSFVITWTLTFS